ncbi:TPA: hypothetical protein JG825_003460 [Vibrio parahaemolyticus]|uniref:hypothetical protein n=1 Tax=Vibrio owensii TaxID=696485 RepID=UPI0018F11CD0|nr:MULTISPECIES: hypothetical protein [Vibrio harveyi group]UPR19079.1 hypothetical protein H9J99_25880 [Vibrio parahaemolyticus]HAV1520141.1 hypothetical protein [Vibrio parahaemolyticus]HAV1539108.1 hypothetical protein [Vibrio parahaemolyticus]
MANEYKNAFEQFEATVSQGITLENGRLIVDTVRDYFDADEVACEEGWSNAMSDEDLSCLVSVEDILNGEDLVHVLESNAEDSFINGQFKQFKEQVENFDDLSDFVDYLEMHSEDEREKKILRWLVLNMD